jgi:hypothetical protein
VGQDPNEIRRDIEQTRAEMTETAGAIGYKADVPARAKDRMTETRERITDKVGSAKESVVGSVGGARDRVSDATPDTDEVKRKAQRVGGMAQSNPLGLAIGATAVGFIAGLLVPATRIEDEKIGEVADRVKDQVKETGQEAIERGKDVAQQAASSAAETAKQSGREQASELSDSARENAQTVSQGR